VLQKRTRIRSAENFFQIQLGCGHMGRD
jgi:hypothetical protein